ncbi:MAG: GNAT family N-acetyltransferase [Rhizobiales bacterium]|nr:GNAT family N-acetyltransferase [Hyphomicrobiales bacterium]NRB14035.1 GNAT family N-acetyltransferase [Hyphomicrobiales bacterium]
MQFKLLSVDQCQAILNFETENREFFEQYVPPRPPGYFQLGSLRKIIKNLVAEQDSGQCYLYLAYQDDEIIGRLNLVNVQNGTAELGYRLAENSTGKGLATKLVTNIIHLAKTDHQLIQLVARAKNNHIASLRVLTNNHFIIDKTQANSGDAKDEPQDITHFKLVIN